MAEKRPMTNP
uniref:Uncharacterized protein n=1 Tax=Lepeophtheirus salmonis TaxID=72036 RepID=A0A0K2VIQ0_LEPSM